MKNVLANSVIYAEFRQSLQTTDGNCLMQRHFQSQDMTDWSQNV